MSQIGEMDKGSIFLPEENRLLNKTIDIREKIVDHLLEDGLPHKTSEIRVINELLNSIDSQILGKVDRRLKNDDNKNQEDVVLIISEMLKNINAKKASVQIEERNIELTEGLRPDEIVLGEDKIEYEELSLEDFKD